MSPDTGMMTIFFVDPYEPETFQVSRQVYNDVSAAYRDESGGYITFESATGAAVIFRKSLIRGVMHTTGGAF